MLGFDFAAIREACERFQVQIEMVNEQPYTDDVMRKNKLQVIEDFLFDFCNIILGK